MFYCNINILKQIAVIQPGYSLRSKVPENTRGAMAILQMKDVERAGISWETLTRMDPTGRKAPRFLKLGDIVFSGRGTKIFAAAVDINPVKTVAGPQFFVITPEDPGYARYITWYINASPGQHYFWTNSAGSSILNVKKEVLENLPIPVPAEKELSVFIKLIEAMEKESKLFSALQGKRQRLLEGIIQKSREAQ